MAEILGYMLDRFGVEHIVVRGEVVAVKDEIIRGEIEDGN
jgi:hypothetical protein